MYYRPSLTSHAMDLENSFQLHTWMIAKLIETSGRDRDHLAQYVIASCYGKMITRMTYRVSESFLDALKNLPPTFELSKRFSRISAGDSSDKRFTQFLFKVNNTLKLRTPIDNLVKHENDLYNQETCTDFHSILCELLELLLSSLIELKDIHCNLKGKSPTPTQLADVYKKLRFVGCVGTLLRLLVRSQAIKKCLDSIVRFLPDRAAGVKAKVDNETNDDDDVGHDEDGLYSDDEEEEEEEESQLEGVDKDSAGRGSGSIKLEPKSQACLRLLTLGVVYFDAILVLSHYVKTQNSKLFDIDINIQVLLLPYPAKDVSMLSWRTLLQHETYFPGKPSPSATEIVEFLELQTSSTDNQRSTRITTDNQKSIKKGQKSSKSQNKSRAPVSTVVSPESVIAKLADLRRDIHNLKEGTFISEIDNAIDSLTTLQFGDVTPGSMTYIDNIVKKLDIAKGLYLNDSDLVSKDDIDDIMEMLRTLADNTRLERMLRKGSALDTGVGFKGSLHAEACIAAHCTFTDAKWLSQVSYFIIMFCSDLLILLVGYYSSSRCI
jgi:hypothetical protein